MVVQVVHVCTIVKLNSVGTITKAEETEQEACVFVFVWNLCV